MIVELMDSICVAKHGFEGYYDDSYYDTERYFIKNRYKESLLRIVFW